MVLARERIQPIFGIRTAVLDYGGLGGSRAPLQVEVMGDDVDELQRVSAEVLAAIEAIPGIVDARNTMGEPRPEYRIQDRKSGVEGREVTAEGRSRTQTR